MSVYRTIGPTLVVFLLLLVLLLLLMMLFVFVFSVKKLFRQNDAYSVLC